MTATILITKNPFYQLIVGYVYHHPDAPFRQIYEDFSTMMSASPAVPHLDILFTKLNSAMRRLQTRGEFIDDAREYPSGRARRTYRLTSYAAYIYEQNEEWQELYNDGIEFWTRELFDLYCDGVSESAPENAENNVARASP